MCGRYASSRRPEDLVEEFEIPEHVVAPRLEPSWNVAPTDEVYGVVERPPGEDRPEPERQLRALRWGLVPFWAKERSIGARMINARSETLAQKPAFRRAYERRRCLLPADGYYEWYASQHLDAKGRPRKQPFFIRPADGSVLALAGLYEIWRDPDRAEDDPDRFVWSCTVITTRAADELGHIHDRMPMTVARDDRAAWLDPEPTAAEALGRLLVPAAAAGLTAFPVGTAVGNVANDGPGLIEPLPLEEALVDGPAS